MFFKISILKNCACNFIKNKLPTQVFPCKYSKILQDSLFIKHLRWLLLHNQDTVLALPKIVKLHDLGQVTCHIN